MTIHKDNNTGKWYFSLRYQDENLMTKQTTRRGFERKKDAVEAQRAFLEETKRARKENMNFEEIARHFMSYSVNRKKEQSVFVQNNLIKTVILPYFKGMNIHTIGAKDIDDFYRSIYDRYSNDSLKNVRRYLKAIYRFAISFYDVQRDVVALVDLPRKEEQPTLKYWTMEEFLIFEKVLRTPKQRAMFNILFWSGIRKGEMLALKIEDVNFHKNTITVNKNWNGKNITTTKNESSNRTVSVPSHVLKIIQELIAHKRVKYKNVRQTDFLFNRTNTNIPLSPSSVNKLLNRGISKTELSPIRVHYFRHSHASMLINEGVSLYVVSRHLGHSDVNTTANIYGHLYPNTEHELGTLLESKYLEKSSDANEDA